MDLLDANVLIGTFRQDDPDHATLKGWLEETLSSGSTVTYPPLVEVAFLRIVTHPGIFRAASLLDEAVGFLKTLEESGRFRETPWNPRIRAQWLRWCQTLDLRGNDVNDAYLAATAAASQCRLVSRDEGFTRFRGLNWWDPTGRLR